MKHKQEVLEILQKQNEILSRLDERMTAIESGKRVAKRKAEESPIRILAVFEQIAQRVKSDLKTKQFVVLSRYGDGGSIVRAKRLLQKDPEVRVISESKITIVMLKETAPTDKPKAEKVVVVAGKRKTYPTHTSKMSEQKDAVRAYLSTGRGATIKTIARIIGRGKARARRVFLTFKREQGYTIVKKGKTYHLYKSGGKALYVPTPRAKAHHEPPMHPKSAYNAFMQRTLRQLRGENMSNADAWRIATGRWNQLKGGRAQSRVEPIVPLPQSAPVSQFPAFRSIKPEYQPILVGVLEKLAKSGIAIDYRGIAYALDITTESEYKALVEEIIEKWEQVKAYFGASGTLSWDGRVLSLRQ